MTGTETVQQASEIDPKTGYPGDVTEFLALAREYYDFDLRCDRNDREAAEDDNAFANASDNDTAQWDQIALEMRRVPGAERPVQQWNRIPTYVQQVVNDGRQNKPAIKISPAEGGTKETATYFQDRIRHIEYECNADTAYDTARDQQVTSGRGFVRVDYEYIPGTFTQRACITPIDNQFSVVWDAAATKYDLSDADHIYVISRISRDKFIREYGSEKIASTVAFAGYSGSENPCPTWIGVGDTGKLIQIAEYWKRVYRKRTLCDVMGIPIWKDTLSSEQYATFKANGQIWNEREDEDSEIWQYIIDGAEILKKPVKWIGSTIPIVPFWGRIAVVNAQRRTFSLIRNAKDPQRLVNLYVSNIAELIAQMPKSPYLVPIGGIPAHLEEMWAGAGNSPLAYLLYNATGPNGQPIPPPSRIVNEPPIQALTIGLQQAIEGIKAAMGIYDASLGARSNETSGIAIDQRRKSAEVVNFHFPDNEARSRKRIGEILIEIIPQIDKPGTEQPVRTEDGKAKTVPIGKEFQDPKTGQKITHVLTDGDYGVGVSTGPSYLSAMQASFERDTELIKADPELMWVFGDQMFAADNTPGAEDRAERMRTAINIKTPGLIPPEDGQAPIPPQIQQQLIASQKEAADAKAFAQSLHEQIATKQPELTAAAKTEAAKLENAKQLKQMELEAEQHKSLADMGLRKYICDQQEETKRTLGLATVDQVDAITLLKEEIGVMKAQHQQLHERVMQAADHAHEADQAEAQRTAAAEQQENAQDHEAEQSDADREAAAEAAETAQQNNATEGAE